MGVVTAFGATESATVREPPNTRRCRPRSRSTYPIPQAHAMQIFANKPLVSGERDRKRNRRGFKQEIDELRTGEIALVARSGRKHDDHHENNGDQHRAGQSDPLQACWMTPPTT
jgi:hypothetical protein